MVEGLFSSRRRLYKRVAQFSHAGPSHDDRKVHQLFARQPYPSLVSASESLAKRLRSAYGIPVHETDVIIDAPPVLAATEAVVLAKYVDEIVFVVEANATPEPAVASALDELLDINPNVSLLLNRCVIASGGSHYGSYEYYDRDQNGEEHVRGQKNA